MLTRILQGKNACLSADRDPLFLVPPETGSCYSSLCSVDCWQEMS